MVLGFESSTPLLSLVLQGSCSVFLGQKWGWMPENLIKAPVKQAVMRLAPGWVAGWVSPKSAQKVTFTSVNFPHPRCCCLRKPICPSGLHHSDLAHPHASLLICNGWDTVWHGGVFSSCRPPLSES